MIKEQVLNTDMSEVEDIPQIFCAGSFLFYQQKMINLLLQGYSRAKAEEMCNPKPIDYEQVMAEVMVMQKRELRNLAKLSKINHRAARLRKSEPDLKIEIATEPDQAQV